MGIFGVAQKAAATAVRVVTGDNESLTVHRITTSGSPITGPTVTERQETFERAAFPDNSMARYIQGGLLPGNERLVVVAQRPILDAGWTIEKDDWITHRGVKSKVLQVVEDPAQALYELRVKP